jgi:hypothetical protein
MIMGYNNEKGIALVTALLLTLIGLAIILAAIYFVTQGTKMSGLQKRYATALEASHGGLEIITQNIIPKTIGGTNLSSLAITGVLNAAVADTCFSAKLTQPASNWYPPTGTCNIASNNLNPLNSPDIQLTLNGVVNSANLLVSVKIVDTEPGNTDTSGISLLGSGVVGAQSGIITPQHIPYLYRVEVEGQRQTNPDEKASLSAVYAY